MTPPEKATVEVPREDLLPDADQVRDYVIQNHQELKNASSISIGKVGDILKVIVTDSQHVSHTLEIPPKEILQYLDKKKEMATPVPDRISTEKDQFAADKTPAPGIRRSKEREKDFGRER